MIRSACVLCVSLAYIFIVGGPLLVYTLLSGKTDLIYRLGVRGARLAVWLAGARLHVVGREKIERKRAVVFMANHQSNCDPPALIGLLPPVLILGKREFFRVPILGRAMRLRGFIPVERQTREKAIESIDRAAEALARGHSFLVFPEGTRSPDGRLLPFKKGVFIMARQAGVPIQPVSVSGSRRVMPKGKITMRPGQVKITFHEAIETSRAENIEILRESVRRAILSALAPDEWPSAAPPEMNAKAEPRHNELPPSYVGDLPGTGKTSMIQARKYRISGRVQGVGFRFFAQREAKALGLRGWVRNLPDGRVEAYAMGDERSLSKFSKLLARGPSSAQVARVEQFDEPLDDGYASFEIGI